MSESYQPAETYGRGSTQQQLNGDHAGSSDDVTFFASYFGPEDFPGSQRQQAVSPGSRLRHAPAAQGQLGEHQGRQQGQDMRHQSQGWVKSSRAVHMLSLRHRLLRVGLANHVSSLAIPRWPGHWRQASSGNNFCAFCSLSLSCVLFVLIGQKLG